MLLEGSVGSPIVTTLFAPRESCLLKLWLGIHCAESVACACWIVWLDPPGAKVPAGESSCGLAAESVKDSVKLSRFERKDPRVNKLRLRGSAPPYIKLKNFNLIVNNVIL